MKNGYGYGILHDDMSFIDAAREENRDSERYQSNASRAQ